ncbi:MAG: gluconeogenesis factor YvcK family protein [Chloroflexota bacterium]
MPDVPLNDNDDVSQLHHVLRRRERGQLIRQWLRPGVGVKRWLLLVFVGLLLIALAVAVLLRIALADVSVDPQLRALIETLTLQSLPPVLRWSLPFALGLIVFIYGAWRLVRALVEPYRAKDEPLAELLYQRRLRARGPRIVAIGGGTGLSTLLRGLKELTSNLTAVVTVADDGGSSGKLRTELGMPPMGDIRNCIAALADAEPHMRRLLQYRFPQYEGADPAYAGHAFGNLLIAALVSVTGDFEEGVRQSNRVLAVRGSVVPVAGRPVTLHAGLIDGSLIDGQSLIARARGIRHVWITPDDVQASTDALAAIAAAELIVIGPGSLYTSLLPPLLVPGIRAALETSPATRLLVVNVATQVGETETFGLSDHLEAIASHDLGGLIDGVMVNNNFNARQPANYPAAPVRIDLPLSGRSGPALIARDVVDDDNAHHHDPRKLAAAIFEVYDERFLAKRRKQSRAKAAARK